LPAISCGMVHPPVDEFIKPRGTAVEHPFALR
jgi:hypothetical protein